MNSSSDELPQSPLGRGGGGGGARAGGAGAIFSLIP
jgi:hypothetical protein